MGCCSDITEAVYILIFARISKDNKFHASYSCTFGIEIKEKHAFVTYYKVDTISKRVNGETSVFFFGTLLLFNYSCLSLDIVCQSFLLKMGRALQQIFDAYPN